MNGTPDASVLDSCFCMNFLNRRIKKLPDGFLIISPITRMELLAKPEYEYNKAEERRAKSFLDTLSIMPIDDEVEERALKIRRANTNIKLPDAIVTATAAVLDVKLVTCDAALVSQLKVALPELCAEYVKPLDSPV